MSEFAFDFFVEAATTAVTTSTTTTTHQEPAPNSNDNDNKDHREPFGWMTNLSQLLQDRCGQDLACHEIHLQQQASEEKEETQQEDEEDASTTSTASIAPESILRHVDLTESCFLLPNDETTNDNPLNSHEPRLDYDSDDPEEQLLQQPVQTGVYEGGLQVWECSWDLVRYLQAHPIHHHITLEANCRVLELGCGHALPGLYLLRQSLLSTTNNNNNNMSLVLTDYNHSVLYNAVVSNLVLNGVQALLYHKNNDNDNTTEDAAQQQQVQACQQIASQVQCAHGDWLGLLEQKDNNNDSIVEPFDVILAAETCYTWRAAQETCRLVAQLLNPKSPSSVALIATKRYYFGVGGGSEAFLQALQEYPQLQATTVQVVDNGRQNIREILQVTRRSN